MPTISLNASSFAMGLWWCSSFLSFSSNLTAVMTAAASDTLMIKFNCFEVSIAKGGARLQYCLPIDVRNMVCCFRCSRSWLLVWCSMRCSLPDWQQGIGRSISNFAAPLLVKSMPVLSRTLTRYHSSPPTYDKSWPLFCCSMRMGAKNISRSTSSPDM